jgi:hypothetical protein
VQQVAATGRLPVELGGNIHLFRQRWWSGTFIPALLTPPPNGSSLLPPHAKLGELLVDRGMLPAQQVSQPSTRAKSTRLTHAAVGRLPVAGAAAGAGPQAGAGGAARSARRWRPDVAGPVDTEIKSRAAARDAGEE